MKTHIICALIALLPVSLLAANTVTVEAAFVQAKSRRAITHDLKKLSTTKGIYLTSAPRVTTRTGQAAEIAITRDFYVRSVAPAKHPLIPTGIVLRVTPYVTRGGVTYRAQITIREYESVSGPGTPPVATFTSREIYASGTPKTGEEVWLDLPSRDGQATAVRLVFKRNDA
jgi:type II secretory pathway component GspD/PulD (secretin)